MIYHENEKIEQLKAMIDSENLLDDYNIECTSNELRLWW